MIVDAQFEDVKSSKVEENINTKEFKEDTFLKGAQAAYEMIVNAFASADKKTLKDLTSPEVYKSFVAVLDDRKNKKLLNQFTFIGKKSFLSIFLKYGPCFNSIISKGAKTLNP